MTTIDALPDELMPHILKQCKVLTLRSLKGASRVWRTHARGVLCSAEWRALQVHDLSLNLDGLSWVEIGELLRALHRDGVCVEQLRCYILFQLVR